MADTARARKLAKRIVAIVATELEHSVKDPRLAMVTITAATVTPDLRDATVFYTVYGSPEEVAESAKALASATGVLRSAVGRDTGVKFTPTLAFRIDAVPETAQHIDDLLAKARAADAAVAAQAAGASYAGEPDPYRVPRADEADDDEADDDEARDDGSLDADDDSLDADDEGLDDVEDDDDRAGTTRPGAESEPAEPRDAESDGAGDGGRAVLRSGR